MQIKSKIKEYIAANLLFSAECLSCSDDASLLKEGIVDSMGVMELVTFVENTFGITVDQSEVTPDNFDSVTRLAGFVRGKQQSNRPTVSR